MDGTIQYLNTDLDLTSREDLTALVAALSTRGMYCLMDEPTRGEDGLWYATFETDESYREPEPNIAAIVAIVESLEAPLRQALDRCTIRELNIGYDCGSKPWAFNQAMSADLLGRMANIGASLRLTLYPPTRENDGALDTVGE